MFTAHPTQETAENSQLALEQRLALGLQRLPNTSGALRWLVRSGGEAKHDKDLERNEHGQNMDRLLDQNGRAVNGRRVKGI